MEVFEILIASFTGVSLGAGLWYIILQLVKSYKLERKLRQAEEEAEHLENLEERVSVLELRAVASTLLDFLREENTNDAEN